MLEMDIIVWWHSLVQDAQGEEKSLEGNVQHAKEIE